MASMAVSRSVSLARKVKVMARFVQAKYPITLQLLCDCLKLVVMT